MQRAEDSSSRLLPEPSSKRAGLRPTTAFVVLLLVVIVAGTLIYVTRPDAPPAPTGTTTPNAQPNFALTNEEALVRLRNLDQLRQQAYAAVDPSLLASIYISGSEVLEIATSDLATMRTDRVRDESVYNTRSVNVRLNTPDRVVIVQEVDVKPHFIRKSGKEVTSGPRLIRRTVRWVLERQGSEWFVADSLITKARVLRG